MLHDALGAFRSLRRSPLSTAASILVSALGIGATASVFTLFSALFLRPVSPDGDRLVQIGLSYRAGSNFFVSDAHYAYWKDRTTSFDDLVASSGPFSANIVGGPLPEAVTVTGVSESFFRTLRFELIEGAGFDWRPGAPAAEVILSHGLWARSFASDPSVVGRQIRVDGASATVVGVMASPNASVWASDLWMPLQLDQSTRRYHLSVAGRLSDGRSVDEAQAELDRIQAEGLAHLQYAPGIEEGVSVLPLAEHLYGDRQPTILLLLMVSGLVLVLACANIATLRVSQVATRLDDVAIRTSLGASPYLVLRPLLLESLLLALAGGILGLGIAVAGSRWLLAAAPEFFQAAPQLRLDYRVVGFALAAVGLAAVAGALAPVLAASRMDVQATLASRTGTDRKGAWFSASALVTIETAVTLLALLTSITLLRSHERAARVNRGFDAYGRTAIALPFPRDQYAKPQARAKIQDELLPQLRAIPGVVSAGATTSLPAESPGYLFFTIAEDEASTSSHGRGLAKYKAVTPAFEEPLGMRLLRGRSFLASDSATSAGVVIINETAARRHWPNKDPIGQRINIYPGTEFSEPERTIVGVVADIAEEGLTELHRWDSLYVPLPQMPEALARQMLSTPLELVIHSELAATSLVSQVREAIAAFDPSQPVGEARLMNTVVRQSLDAHAFRAQAVSGFAALTSILAAVGIYGVLSALVASRKQELGIRIALGSTSRRIVGLLLRQVGYPLGLGVLLGVGAVFAAARVLEAFLFGTSAIDPSSIAAGTAILAGTAVVAALVPALRAARTDPNAALRTG